MLAGLGTPRTGRKIGNPKQEPGSLVEFWLFYAGHKPDGARSTDLQPIRTESVALPEPPLESGTERGAERTAPDMGRCIATSPARSVMLLFCFGGVFLRASFVTNTKAALKLRFLDV